LIKGIARMGWLHTAFDLFRHLDQHLNDFASAHPIGVYALLATIVFCETGFVVTPFLPGDSLLFAVGALAAASASPINLTLVIVLLCLSANCGDLVNYSIGRRVGPAVFSRESSFLLNKKHLTEAQAFYDRHGRKTIILARFVPIIRTFAPFVAGIGRMRFSRFVTFSIAGGMLWVTSLSLSGYFFGNFEIVKKHFELVVVAIVVISVLPVVMHALKARSAPTTTEKRVLAADTAKV
jgi:membrane-associated protein